MVEIRIRIYKNKGRKHPTPYLRKEKVTKGFQEAITMQFILMIKQELARRIKTKDQKKRTVTAEGSSWASRVICNITWYEQVQPFSLFFLNFYGMYHSFNIVSTTEFYNHVLSIQGILQRLQLFSGGRGVVNSLFRGHLINIRIHFSLSP